MEFVDENRHKSGADIKVFGVGGCGGNVVTTMIRQNLENVRLVALNTDLQALERIQGAECVQLGKETTRGLGAGGRVDIAAQAAQEDDERIRELVEGTDMLFITAGMGGGTGTGAAPVIAEIAASLGVLTIAVVCRPFRFESRDRKADAGIANLAQHVDSLIVVSNERLRDVLGPDTPAADAFRETDQVLHGAVSGICDVIHKPGFINVDFADVRNVMAQAGMAVMGSGADSGVDRATRAAHAAIECPLLEDHSLSGAKGLLINISATRESVTLAEIEEIQKLIKKDVSDDAEVFFGAVFDDSLGEELRVTVIATGLENPHIQPDEPARPQASSRPVLRAVPPQGNGAAPPPAVAAHPQGRPQQRGASVISSARRVNSANLDLEGAADNTGKVASFLRRQIS